SPNNFYFHRCCGGALDSPEAIWGVEKARPADPALDREGDVTLCAKDRTFQWHTTAAWKDIEKIFIQCASLPVDSHLQTFKTSELTPGGRNRTFEALFNLPGGQT